MSGKSLAKTGPAALPSSRSLESRNANLEKRLFGEVARLSLQDSEK